MFEPLTREEIAQRHDYWRVSNYLTVGQIHLEDNTLLDRPLTKDDITGLSKNMT